MSVDIGSWESLGFWLESVLRRLEGGPVREGLSRAEVAAVEVGSSCCWGMGCGSCRAVIRSSISL